MRLFLKHNHCVLFCFLIGKPPSQNVLLKRVTSLCWWLNDGDNFKMLTFKSVTNIIICQNVMLVPNSRCWWRDFSPTSKSCHQHIWSPTPVTNIDVTIFGPLSVGQKNCVQSSEGLKGFYVNIYLLDFIFWSRTPKKKPFQKDAVFNSKIKFPSRK